jgi:hypothetical protein
MRLGDALLKQEDEEMQRIASLAQQLLDAESNTPAPPLACTAERAACSACYEQNAAQPLSCKAQVEAFARCADNALKVCSAAAMPRAAALPQLQPALTRRSRAWQSLNA